MISTNTIAHSNSSQQQQPITLPVIDISPLLHKDPAHKDDESYQQVIREIGLTRVYRGFFELGGELTYGKKDWKEGYYFSAELNDDHPAVKGFTNAWFKSMAR
ncbi:hypothetical protein FDP41_001994 [Naegleria fowleri]|uniref:Uncharacterized protein n=1 Tax=Naegleria fowleri TaxID=5763 RepID=A0A6A5BX81_NAEFO|nr:uncharacterized protein FDP41_001994 [Naegleria fowleri]KAF0978924.1 hypothetical protein FDP41_001994 [Naegleria fowleri]